ncbi:MAG: GNAT family N-acetyltransferase [Microbacteriaceae bacterium]
MAHPYWPLFDLEVRTPRLTLRGITDELAVALAALAARGIHDDDFMPFAMPWSRRPSPELERQALQFYWRCRAETSPASWNLNLVVLVDGEVVGTSGLIASDFARMRQFETGSWLGREHQGRGIGKEMRLATLALGFDGFGAEWATTGAWHDNGPSLGVTRSLGYAVAGHRRAIRDDREPDTLLGFEMPRSHFDEHLRRDDIELIGVEQVRELLGISR